MMQDSSYGVDAGQQADAARLAMYRTAVRRLPITMRPAIYHQLAQWNSLFPFEQQGIQEFMRGLESFSSSALKVLLGPLRALEIKMGVGDWEFDESDNTLENVSKLARSKYYVDWRNEVQRVFETIERAGRAPEPPQRNLTRLILIILPASLPVMPLATWKPWDPRARGFDVEGDARSICDMALNGAPYLPAIAEILSAKAHDASDLWLIDGDERKGGLIQTTSAAAYMLNYAALKAFRDEFLAEINNIPKDLHATDQVRKAVRGTDWTPLCPVGLAGDARLRDFVIDLFLSGNGALIFSNAFVEWAASEALRRARPRVLVARYGMRTRPKPFTGIAIFENQENISTLPEIDDPQGSAVDAVELARYIWLAALRYPEQEQTCCLCVPESLNAVYLIAPSGQSPDWSENHSASPREICAWVGSVLKE